MKPKHGGKASEQDYLFRLRGHCLRQADVLLVDTQELSIDKPCGEGLMPDSCQELSKLGIELAPAHGARFAGIRVADPCSTVSAEFAQGAGLGIRRLVLHQ
jgi:hypothetical protein